MRVYFYHTQDIQRILREHAEGRFPGHLLYGATHLHEYGIEVVWHQSIPSTSRLRQMLHSLWGVLANYRRVDAVFATHYRGFELVVLLRALRLIRKPIVVWHHQPVITPRQRWREWLGRLFYRGFDHLFFFSQKLIDDSLTSRKVRPERMHLGHWGPDLDFYDRLMREQAVQGRTGFVSSGKELRDMPTLVEAFNLTGAPIDIYVNMKNGDIDYEQVFSRLSPHENVRLHFVKGLIPYELCLLVNQSACVVICCQESKYTVGLTTVVEALALGLPILISRNPQIPIDFEKEGCGISVPYYDVNGWQEAVQYVVQHSEEAAEMGRRGRLLAERQYNDRLCASEVAQVLLSLEVKGGKRKGERGKGKEK